MASFKPALYEKVSSRDDLSQDSEDDQEKQPQTSRMPRTSTIILSLTTLGFAVYSLYILVLGTNSRNNGAFSAGYETEWGTDCSPNVLFGAGRLLGPGPAKASINIQQVEYTSALRYNATSKTYYRDFDPMLPQYVGKPSPEVDKAWEDLLRG